MQVDCVGFDCDPVNVLCPTHPCPFRVPEFSRRYWKKTGICLVTLMGTFLLIYNDGMCHIDAYL